MICLTFYIYEFQKHHGIALYEWLLELAKKHDLETGSAYRSIAGYSNHGKMHEEHFFELASNVSCQAIFISSKEKIDLFLAKLKAENLKLFATTHQLLL